MDKERFVVCVEGKDIARFKSLEEAKEYCRTLKKEGFVFFIVKRNLEAVYEWHETGRWSRDGIEIKPSWRTQGCSSLYPQ
jgi:hypothetical protein